MIKKIIKRLNADNARFLFASFKGIGITSVINTGTHTFFYPSKNTIQIKPPSGKPRTSKKDGALTDVF